MVVPVIITIIVSIITTVTTRILPLFSLSSISITKACVVIDIVSSMATRGDVLTYSKGRA